MEELQVSEMKAVGEVGLLGLSPRSMVSDDVVYTFLQLVAIERSETHGLFPQVAPSGHTGVHFLPTGWLWAQRRGMLSVLHSVGYDRVHLISNVSSTGCHWVYVGRIEGR
eukprot:1105146-Rhodomonas_salina.1